MDLTKALDVLFRKRLNRAMPGPFSGYPLESAFIARARWAFRWRAASDRPSSIWRMRAGSAPGHSRPAISFRISGFFPNYRPEQT